MQFWPLNVSISIYFAICTAAVKPMHKSRGLYGLQSEVFASEREM